MSVHVAPVTPSTIVVAVDVGKTSAKFELDRRGVASGGCGAAGRAGQGRRRSSPHEWKVLELNPAHVAQQRRVQGRRPIKTDVIGEINARAVYRSRRIATRTATNAALRVGRANTGTMAKVITRPPYRRAETAPPWSR